MVSEGSLQIKKGSCFINKANESNSNIQHLSKMPTVGNIDHLPWTEDHLEFKKFIHDELTSMKASMVEQSSLEENKSPKPPEQLWNCFYSQHWGKNYLFGEGTSKKQDIINILLTSPNVERRASFVEEAHNPKVKLQHRIEKDISEQNIVHKHIEQTAQKERIWKRMESKMTKECNSEKSIKKCEHWIRGKL